jgi:DNA-binding CsgD family transcriptional regulator
MCCSARNLEPYRGFHIFMRALQHIQREHPTCQALIVGGDGVSYGKRPKDAPTWREQMLREVKLDPSRTHFLGRLPHAQYLRVLQLSAAHVYLTYPFVLSWSMLEAMGCGVPIVGSDTAPVREVLRDGRNGRLVPFFDVRATADKVVEMLRTRKAQIPMRKQARAAAQRFSLGAGLVGYDKVVGGQAADLATRTEMAPRAMREPNTSIIALGASNVAAGQKARGVTGEIEFSRIDVELLRLVSAGHSTKQIAELRSRSPATVRNQLSALYQKLGVARRSEAVAKLVRRKLEEPES